MNLWFSSEKLMCAHAAPTFSNREGLEQQRPFTMSTSLIQILTYNYWFLLKGPRLLEELIVLKAENQYE